MRSAAIVGIVGFCALVLLVMLPLADVRGPETHDRRSSFVRTAVVRPQTVAAGFEKIGPVCTNLWTFSALNLDDPVWKTNVFYITSFNAASHGQLIRLDYRRNRAASWELPEGIGSWGIIRGQNGRLYLGSYNGGELLSFDPRAERWVPLPQMPEAFRRQENIICDLAQAPDGSIYYGTYPGCHLVRYDPRAGTLADLGKAADENYLRFVAVTPSGVVLCGVGPRQSGLIAYDPATRQFRTLTPERYRTSAVTPRPLLTASYAVEPSKGKLLTYDIHTLRFVRAFDLAAAGVQVLDTDRVLYQDEKDGTIRVLDLRDGSRSAYFHRRFSAANGRFYRAPDGNLFGLRVQSYSYTDIKSGATVRRRIPVDGLGQEVLWLNSFPDGRIWGGPGLGQTAFSFDPKSHTLTSYDQVIDQGGEVYYGVPWQGRLYTISYVEATLAVFDPARPWNQGSTPDSNPRTILTIPQDQYRPVGGIHVGPQNKLYIGTQPNYGMIGGALSVFDPATGKLQVYRNLIPDEEISAVAADSRYVYCGADPSGGGGSKPVANNSHFFVWDPHTQKIVFDETLPQASGLGGIATVNGHAYFVRGRDVMDYDSQARQLRPICQLDRVRRVPLESLKAAKDGSLWAIAGDELVHIRPTAGKVRFFPETASHATSGLAIAADGTIYFGAGTDVWIHRPKAPSPPARYGQ